MSPTTYLPTYTEIAKTLDIPWCRGIRANGQRCHATHRPGSADDDVHFTDRRVTRAGIRRFLFLAAKVIVDQQAEQAGGQPEWVRFYRANRLVTEWIKTAVRIEMPRSVTAPYKTQLKAMLAAVEPGDPEREEAWLWTSR